MMNYYLASDISALELVGDGKVLAKVNTLLKEDGSIKLVAFHITGNAITRVALLFSVDLGDSMSCFTYREFDYFEGTVDDIICNSIKYHAGVSEFQMKHFSRLKQFYLKSIPKEESVK